jgi:ubiquinone/menaquinone biosynthesis C-methylase UbiE
MFVFLLVVAGCFGYFYITHFISYNLIKKRILNRHSWDLNICCGQTDGGGINVDIVEQKNVPNFRLIEDIYSLPFEDGEFDTVLCSHTIEHVEFPKKFFKELDRVGNQVTIVIPPFYDITAALNVFEHRYLFLSFKKEHKKLPPHIRLPLSDFIQKRIGQINQASSSSSVPLFFRLIYSLFSSKYREKIKSDRVQNRN